MREGDSAAGGELILRRHDLFNLPAERGALPVAELVAKLGVTGQTIQRDMKVLSAKGLVEKSGPGTSKLTWRLVGVGGK